MSPSGRRRAWLVFRVVMDLDSLSWTACCSDAGCAMLAMAMRHGVVVLQGLLLIAQHMSFVGEIYCAQWVILLVQA